MRNRQKIKVGHDVFIPEGIEDIFYDELPFDETDIEEDNDPDGDINEGPPAPETFKIVSQTLREAKNGQFTVDVVIETDDYEGYEIDFRVSKE